MRERLAVGNTRSERSLERTLRRAAARAESLDARLRSLSPLAVLDRGYALVLGADGALIRSTGQLGTGDHVRTRLSDGEFGSTVDAIDETKQRKK